MGARRTTETAAYSGVLSVGTLDTYANYVLVVCVRGMTSDVALAEWSAVDTFTGFLRSGPNTRVEL